MKIKTTGPRVHHENGTYQVWIGDIKAGNGLNREDADSLAKLIADGKVIFKAGPAELAR